MDLLALISKLKDLSDGQLTDIVLNAGVSTHFDRRHVSRAERALDLCEWAKQSSENLRKLGTVYGSVVSESRSASVGSIEVSDHTLHGPHISALKRLRDARAADGLDTRGLDTEINESIDTSITKALTPDHPDLLGGKYNLQRAVGKSAFATVYRGRDVETGNVVAVKLVDQRYVDDPQLKQRFYNACQVLKALKGRGAVNLYEGPISEGNWLYCVTEFVEGCNLAELFKTDTAFVREHAAAILEKIGTTIEHAHNLGFIHRDLKLTNVLIDRSNGLEVHLTDFETATSPLLTAATEFGYGNTFLFSAPEVTDDPSTATMAADVWSLGVIALALFTGVAPTTRLLHRPAELLRKSNCNQNLKSVLQAALEYEPKLRPANAIEFMRNYRWAMEEAPQKGRKTDGSPLLACISDATLIPIFRDGQRFRTREDARHSIEHLRHKYQHTRNDAGLPDDLLLWVSGFDLSQEDQERGLVGNFARLTIEQGADGWFSIAVMKIVRDRHPIRAYKRGRQHPNWGHPILRRIVSGRVFPNERAAIEDLKALAEEYPRPARSDWARRRLGMIVWEPIDRQSGSERVNPTRPYIFEVVEEPAGITVSYRPNDRRPPASNQDAVSVPAAPEPSLHESIEKTIVRIQEISIAGGTIGDARFSELLMKGCDASDLRNLATSDHRITQLLRKKKMAKAILRGVEPEGPTRIAIFILDGTGKWVLRNVWPRCSACVGMGFIESELCLDCGGQGWQTDPWQRVQTRVATGTCRL